MGLDTGRMSGTSRCPTWFLATVVWWLLSGVCCLVSGIWYLVSGVCCLVSGIWYLVSGVWCLVSGGKSSPLTDHTIPHFLKRVSDISKWVFILVPVILVVASVQQHEKKDDDDDEDEEGGGGGGIKKEIEERLIAGESRISYHHVQARIDFDQDTTIVPVMRLCFYCCKEGKGHPIEHFLRYPCCGHYLCRDCMRKNMGFCGECLTKIPMGNEYAILWLHDRMENKMRMQNDYSRYMHLLGKMHINGSQLFLDELSLLPVYQWKKLEPRGMILSVMNPSNVPLGVSHLEIAAKDEIISAMLDLADTYCTNFSNDSFLKDKEKAEHWYVKALGKGNKICPLAFTRYGDFLMWEQRFTEAQKMYEIAATYGHARGQHEYALCLLRGNDTAGHHRDDNNDDSGVSNDDTEKAIQFLCKACENGFYAPSYTLLAKTLIDITEKTYGTVYVVGKSPLSRVRQILRLAKDCPYGTSQSWEDETLILLEKYGQVNEKCSNCGEKGSEMYPLRTCGICGVVAYCSNVCQKKDYRDGHKFDCCSSKSLVDFKSVRLTLPWVSKVGWKGGVDELPTLCNTGGRSLVQMVEDETDELYGEEDQDYDQYSMNNLMFQMRKNLETYLQKELQDNQSASPLQSKIKRFSNSIEEYPGWQSFTQAMDKIRTLGNDAAHSQNLDDTTFVQVECENAVREYRLQKEMYEKYKETICHDGSNVAASMALSKALNTSPSNTISKKRNDEHINAANSNMHETAAITLKPLQQDVSIEKKSNKSKKRKKKKREKTNKETINNVQVNDTKDPFCHDKNNLNSSILSPKTSEISPSKTFPKEGNDRHDSSIILNAIQSTVTPSIANERNTEMKSSKPKEKRGGGKKTNNSTINHVQLNDTMNTATINITTAAKPTEKLSSNKIHKGGDDKSNDNVSQSTATSTVEIEENTLNKCKSKSNITETIDDLYTRDSKCIAAAKKNDASEMKPRTKENEISPSLVQTYLDEYIATKNRAGIEQIISKWNGVSGFAKVRKKAKLAAKKLRNESSQLD